MTNAIVTTTARLAMAKGRAGAETLPTIVGMAFGDGGSSGGVPVAPSSDQTSLTHELLRKAIDNYEIVSGEEATIRYYCTLGTAELVGYSIDEIGLYDSNGDLVCIKTFIPKGKDADIEQTYAIDDAF